MSFETETRTVLRCDNGCGAEEVYDECELGFENLATVRLPTGWARDYDNGDSIFKHLCGDCIEDFGEGGY